MDKTKLHKYILVILLAALTVIIAAASLINALLMPDKAFSETENRDLQTFPQLNVDNIIDKSFMSDFESYFSDRFILRETWIKLMNGVDRLTGKREIKGVFTENGRMMEAWKDYDAGLVDRSLSAMQTFAEKYPKISMYFMLAPNAQEIYSETLPPNCGAANQKSFIKMCYDSLPSITGIDAYSSLYAAKNDYIYYRTDHHWTSGGAYVAYTAAANAMGFLAYTPDKFNIEHASSSFRGTLYSKTLDDSVTPDFIDIYTLSLKEPEVNMTIYGGTETITRDSLYMREYLDKKDKYSMFLSPNVPLIEIQTDLSGEIDSGSLLVIKDSYAHSLVPFLSKNYSRITVVDMRYINAYFEDLGIDPEDYNAVLFMYNVITFSSDINLRKIASLG